MDNTAGSQTENDARQNKFARFLIIGLILANLFLWLAVWNNSQRRYLEVSFFDVGQGDAALAQLPNGAQILIDGGPSAAVLEKLGQTLPFYDRDIDWVVLSHPERDHLAGLLAVIENYRVRNIIWSGIAKDNAESRKWSDLIAREGANVVIARPGESFALGASPESILQVLAPESAVSGSGRSANDQSVAVRLVYGARSFLFTGDATSKEEESVLSVGFGGTDVLKVAHHGSKTSADEVFMAGILPSAAVISVGAGNSYGHPSRETLDLLGKYDIKTLRTDESGDIVFQTDGNSLFVKTQK